MTEPKSEKGQAVSDFVRDGFVALRNAVPQTIVARCREQIEAQLRLVGVDPVDASTWTRPVVRFNCPESPSFAAAGTQTVLWDLYDALLGPGTWWKRRGVGGTIAARFPSQVDPGDAGWHVDGSFEGPDGSFWLNVASKGRGLLCLFLFSDVGPHDAPTELKVGSHMDVPRILQPHGETGASFIQVASEFPATTFERESAFATGQAGDVFVCHPFLVHRATWPHKGAQPRLVAQPGVAQLEPFSLTGKASFPVEHAILHGLARNDGDL